ncbi:MAG TPA: DUF433 domain-containing protein [Longimicrobium sp.]|jgi:uncharacterized protein (DUF433 family)
MASRARGIRLSEGLEREIERDAQLRGQSFTSTTSEMLFEAVRMRRVPGVVFTDGPAGRRATIAGTGLDVWEVIATWKDVGEQWTALRESYEWLTDFQLRSAVAYYKIYPQEIDARLAVEERWTPERMESELPFLAPRRER